MKRKILYLFNSAARPVYKDNLHKILATPVGGNILFRYSIKYHVPPRLGDVPHKCESLIVFVDRYSEGGYTYYPIRKATVLKTFRNQNRLFIECRLSEYCGTDEPIFFTNKIREIGDRSPELTNDDPAFNDDGYYVQFTNDITDSLITDSERWFHTVQSISQTTAFKTDSSAFLKLSIKRSKREQHEIILGNEGLAFINSGESYSLDIFYYDPDKGRIEKNLAISFKEPLEKNGKYSVNPYYR